MEIEKIIKDKEELKDLPPRQIYYYGPKLISCSEKHLIKHKNYTFELCIYDISGNGKKYVKIFDSEDKQVLENMTIILEYPGPYSVEFINEHDPISHCYFQFKTNTNFRLEAVLDKLALIAEKKSMYSKFYPSIQYVYAYIMFLFFSIKDVCVKENKDDKDDKIRASEFSKKFNILKKMRDCVSSEFTDNASGKRYSHETVYYKVFNRFIKKQLGVLKGKPIYYDLYVSN